MEVRSGRLHQARFSFSSNTPISGASGDAFLFKQGVTVKEKKEYHALLAEAEGLLSDRTNEAIHERIGLRDAVCAYLDAERAQGVPVEVIRKSIEGILKRAEARAAGGNGSDGHRELAQQLIDWCVELLGQTPKLKIVS